MRRTTSWAAAWSICLCFITSGVSAEGVPSVEDLLPNTTAGLLAVSNMDRLKEHWNKTQLGQLMADPVMEAANKDIRRQLEKRFARIRRRLGLTLEDLQTLPGGEVAAALIRPAPGRAVTVVTCDVAGHLKEANDALERISANLLKQGAKKSRRKMGDVEVMLFDIPTEDDPKGPPQQAAYFLSGNLLVAADDPRTVEEIVARLAGDRKDSLANRVGFKNTMQRCLQDSGPATPQVRWFLHPVTYADAARVATPEDQRRKGKTILELLDNQGFGAIQGIGGFIDFDAESFEIVHRTAVFAPPPYEKGMKMMVFPNGAEFKPQPWVPREIATYTTLYADVLNAFDNFGSLFDELFGQTQFLFNTDVKYQQDLDAERIPQELRQAFAQPKVGISLSPKATVTIQTLGSLWSIRDKEKNKTYVARKRDGTLKVFVETTGLWDDALAGMEKDPNGPQINLRRDLMAHLGQRISLVTDYQMPITTGSQRLLLGFETSNEKAVAAAIEKLVKDDPTMQKRVVDGHLIWEMVAEEVLDVPKVKIGSVPSLRPKKEPAEKPKEEVEEESKPLLPHQAITVINGYLFVASHIDFLMKVVLPSKPSESLATSPDYQRVDAAIGKLGMKEMCGRFFALTDEQYRPTYELIRQNKLPQSEGLLARFLNAFSGTQNDETRQQQIDGSKLPDFDVVRRYLGPSGVAASSEKDGWFIKGFLLMKE